MKKFTSIFLALLMACASLGCTNAAEADTLTAEKDITEGTEVSKDEESTGETLTLNFADYEDGIVNSYDTGVVENVVKDGKSASYSWHHNFY